MKAIVEERLYIVTYDISNERRWRRVFKLMHGYGRWLQLSVFQCPAHDLAGARWCRHGRWLQLSVVQCRLTARRRAELVRRLEEAIHSRADHALILDLGPADRADPHVESLGKSFELVKRTAVVV